MIQGEPVGGLVPPTPPTLTFAPARAILPESMMSPDPRR
jgi:hypothetical protein